MTSWRELSEEELRKLQERHSSDVRRVKGLISSEPPSHATRVVLKTSGKPKANYAIYLQGLAFVPEYQFAPPRKFRLDFAILEHGGGRLASPIGIEVEGGLWVQGRHVQPMGYENDLFKYNLAAEKGWRIFRYTPQQLKSSAREQIDRVLKTSVVLMPSG